MIDQAESLRRLINSNKQSNKSKLKTRVIAIASGKGGVGKSNFVVNVGIEFAKLGKKVVIIDADLGLANVEVLMGVIPNKNFSHILNNKIKVTDALTDGPYGIKFLSGGSGLRDLVKATEREQLQIINCFDYLDEEFDIILIDIGAGISNMVVNFAKAAHDIIVVTTPEPTAVTDAYALIKILTEDTDDELFINIIINSVVSSEEGHDTFQKLLMVTQKFLKININNLGYLPKDDKLVKAVKKQEPVVISYPETSYSKAIHKIACEVLNINIDLHSDVETIDDSKKFIKKLFGFFGKQP